MRKSNPLLTRLAASIAIAVFSLSGCGSPAEETAPQSQAQSHDGHDHADGEHEAKASHDHSGWWCSEHGVPEEECTRCDSSLIAEFRSTGDWCDEHERPNSQCFLCSPELEGTFAARYEAKFGKQPPKPTDP